MILGENNNTYLSFYPGYSITFSFIDESSNGLNISLFESIANSGSGISEFRTSKKFYIGDLANSSLSSIFFKSKVENTCPIVFHILN